MFRSSTIIRELALNLAKIIFTLKHSVKLRHYLLCCCVAACTGRQHRGGIMPQAVIHSLVLMKMGKIIARNLLS